GIAAGVPGDLRLLIGIEPRGRADDEAAGLQRVLPDVDLRLLGEQRPEDRTGIHRGVDLLAVGHHRVSGERVVMLPAGELTDAARPAVDGAKTRSVSLAPDHSLVIRRRDLAAALKQGSIRIEEELGIVESPAVALVDADRHDDARLLASLADRVDGRRRHSDGLLQQLQVLASGNDLVSRLYE